MTDRPTALPERRSSRRDIAVAAACGVFVAAMVGMAYASVPLYDWFCRATGFGGTTQVSKAGPERALARSIRVRFDSNVTGGLPWKFEPEQNEVEVKVGEVTTVFYSVTNLAARTTYGQASYNVTPLATGIYFNKINCFCFTEQSFKAGERRDLAVVFYVDPKLADDAEQNDLNTITLSYTFYPVKPPRAVTGAADTGRTIQ
jgi:cytochrome c oxidase assembly protein subunit 11